MNLYLYDDKHQNVHAERDMGEMTFRNSCRFVVDAVVHKIHSRCTRLRRAKHLEPGD